MIFSALTVAGSDPSGGAGIQADLKTFSRLGVYGMSVITALTAQNTAGFTSVMDVPPDFVAQQWDAVFSDIPADAMKTGMLANAPLIEIAAGMIEKYGIRNVVLDPVMVSTSGAVLLASDAVETLKRKLIPQALLVTPNIDEARVLSGVVIHDPAGMEMAARRIREMGAQYVLVKGGHLEGDALDVLFDGSEFQFFRSSRIGNSDVHGTGCVLSAAITACLARGCTVIEAVRAGKDFVTEAIANSVRIGKGAHPCNADGLTEEPNASE